jgi:surface polysaccharide O-acyltransferase-like enzyme
MNKTERKLYLDLLRMLSAFAVVLAHVIGKTFFSAEPVSSQLWFQLNLLESGIRWCVPAFVMISGALLLDPQKHVTIGDIWRKYIRHIAIAALFWSAVYAVIEIMRDSRELDLFHRCLDFIITVLLKPADHLWYVYMIIGLYIITPMVRKIISGSSRRELEYWLVTMFVFGILPAFLRNIPVVQQYAGEAIDNANLSFLFGFVFYYAAGYYFAHVHTGRGWPYYLAAIAGYLYTAVVTWYQSRMNGTTTAAFQFLYPNTVTIAIGIFVFFTRHVQKISFSEGARLWLRRLSDASFGVYLAHECVIDIFGLDCVTDVVQALVYAIIAYVLSFAAVMLLRRLKIVRKYLS